MAQLLKNLPAMGETWAKSLELEDPLREEMATHSSIFGGGLYIYTKGDISKLPYVERKRISCLLVFTNVFPYSF